jgi:SAM-dependent methyltransferase
MCHRHFSQRGFTSISFTGIDIAPLSPTMITDDDMNWHFVQHDIRRQPLPFRDEEFSLIMIKDMSLALDSADQQNIMDEYLRVLKPGGVLEIWDGDSSVRMLLPQATPVTQDEELLLHTNAMGTYALTPQTPMAAPHNQFFQDYNTWIREALQKRNLTDMPCTLHHATLHQEAELVEIDSRRLAIPLGDMRWERESVGLSSKGKTKEDESRKQLTLGQAALRHTALMTIVQFIESMEPVLREVSGKGQDEWDRWHANMMTDLLKNNGTSWGECMEVGAWWATKKKAP